MRVYIPATFDMLHQLEEMGEMPIRMGYGFALTDALREQFTEGDEEEIDFFAFNDASLASLRLLTQPPLSHFPFRRVVITADIDDSRLRPDPELSESLVHIDGNLAFKEILAFHVDTVEGETYVERALPLLDRAELGDEGAQLTVGDALDILLAWFDPSELGLLTLGTFGV
ncbi:MAG: hypothetical protein Q3972_00775 [Corynebacterium sp.]|nr:hypothetical protein [Corynebacterium sp.]